MNVPVAVSNIVVGLFAEECIEAEAHLQSICEHFTALSQGAVTVPSKFDSETFPGVTWQDGTIHLQFVRCVQGGTVPGTSTPLDLVLNVVHCPAVGSSLLELHGELCDQLRQGGKSWQVPVETLGFYPTDAQLSDEDVASNRAVHLVLEGQEQMACQFLLANSVTAVLDQAVARIHNMQSRTGIQAHNLLATAQSGALPHLLDGRAVAGAAALCCTAANACIAMDDCGSAADYALIGQRLIDTSLRDIALGAADLLETNRLSVQCALSLGGAAWLSVAPQTAPRAKQQGSSPRRLTSLHGHSVRRWMAAADAFEQGAVSAGSVAQADPHAQMLLSPLPPWAHAALMFASAGVAYSIAAQTMLDGAAAVPMPSESAPAALLSPPKAGAGGSQQEPWAAARQAQQALFQASTFVCSSLALHSSPSGRLSPQLTLAADVALRVAASAACCLLTPSNVLCRTPRRAWSIMTSLARELARAGAVRHAILLASAAVGLAHPTCAQRLGQLLQVHMRSVETQHQSAQSVAADTPLPSATTDAERSLSPGSACSADTTTGRLRAEAGGGDSDSAPADFAGVKASASAKQRVGLASTGSHAAADSVRPGTAQALWPMHTQDMFGALASALFSIGCAVTVAELSVLWGVALQPGGASKASPQPDVRAFCDPLLSHNAAHIMMDALLEPHRVLEHCMHVHTLQACLHGTPYMLDFALALRMSHFLEPQIGTVLPPMQRPWSIDSSWASFFEESVQRSLAVASGRNCIPVSHVPGLAVTKAEWGELPEAARYYSMPHQAPINSSSATADAHSSTSSSFASPSVRSRRAGAGRRESAAAAAAVRTDITASESDSLELQLHISVGGVLLQLLRHSPEGAGGALQCVALQTSTEQYAQLPAPTVIHEGDKEANLVISMSSLTFTGPQSALRVTGLWLQSRGVTWMQTLPAVLHVHCTPPQPRFLFNETAPLCHKQSLVCELEAQSLDSSEVHLAKVLALICSPRQAAKVQDTTSAGMVQDAQLCEVVQGDLGPEATPSSAVAVSLHDDNLQVRVPIQRVLDAAAAAHAGVGEELALLLWAQCSVGSESCVGGTCRLVRCTLPVPPAATAWQSNQGPWDPEEDERVSFWQSALRILCRRDGLLERSFHLECNLELVPPQLVKQFMHCESRDSGGQSTACKHTATMFVDAPSVQPPCVWLGHDRVRVSTLAVPEAVGCVMLLPSAAETSETCTRPFVFIVSLQYYGSGKAYAVQVQLSAS